MIQTMVPQSGVWLHSPFAMSCFPGGNGAHVTKQGKTTFGQRLARLLKKALNQVCWGSRHIHSNPASQISTPIMDAQKSINISCKRKSHLIFFKVLSLKIALNGTQIQESVSIYSVYNQKSLLIVYKETKKVKAQGSNSSRASKETSWNTGKTKEGSKKITENTTAHKGNSAFLNYFVPSINLSFLHFLLK